VSGQSNPIRSDRIRHGNGQSAAVAIGVGDRRIRGQGDRDGHFAKLYIDSELVFTATRASGSILDRNGMSIATLPVLVPPPGESWTGRLEWTSVAGVTRSWTTAQ
jgi:hypothetical protein